jgi:phosphocarrier protein HPr
MQLCDCSIKCAYHKKGMVIKMKEFRYTITDSLGLHARPAGMLVKESGKYKCNIKIISNKKEANAKKILGVMGLGVKSGMEVTVQMEGTDENEAQINLKEFFFNNL